MNANPRMNADITKCINPACPIKHTCLRELTTPRDPRIKYARFRFQNPVNGETKCTYHIPVKK